jgi:thiol-disulfide isomerase/thioredoxin
MNDLFRLPLPVKSPLPGFDGATGWLNTDPLTQAALHGKVVIANFWTYTCINWIRTAPYIRAWAETYGPHGLIVVGVHTPEFTIEHNPDHVRQAADDIGIKYPIAIDNNYAVWDAFANQYWPAVYIADADQRIRYQHFGEGNYESTERVIRHLLAAAGAVELPDKAPVDIRAIEEPADGHNLRSPETYVGLARSVGFASPDRVAFDEPRTYTFPARLHTNEWALRGNWTLHDEATALNEPNGTIGYLFHARDLNLILAPPTPDAPIRFRVRLDGQPPHDAHGLDIDDEGNGIARKPRLYQLIRQQGQIQDRLFEIELIDSGVAAFCFTFG